MRHSFSIVVIVSLLFGAILLGKPGSCEEYALLVCDICGKKSDICAEVKEKSAEHPEDVACQKGLELLPTVYKEASEEDKAKIRKTLCLKQI